MPAEDPMLPPTARAETRLSYDDLLCMPDDGLRHELIDGVHYVTASPNARHQIVLGRLHGELFVYLKAHPEVGHAFLAPLDVVLSDYDVVEPDLLFIARAALDIVTEENVQGPPTLAVEILSPSTRKRDAQLKRRLFERTGVTEYWLLDPELDSVQAFRRTPEAKLARAAELTSEDADTLTTPLLPGFSLALPDLFREGL
jgi:Uma2 family endonuclease